VGFELHPAVQALRSFVVVVVVWWDDLESPDLVEHTFNPLAVTGSGQQGRKRWHRSFSGRSYPLSRK
jgi:hypothetical protein